MTKNLFDLCAAAIHLKKCLATAKKTKTSTDRDVYLLAELRLLRAAKQLRLNDCK